MRKTALTALVLLAPAAPAQAKLPEIKTGGVEYEEVSTSEPDLDLVAGQVVNNGAPLPSRVQRIVEAANRIAHKPYLWGGGHSRFRADGYDCSGSVSYALHGGNFLRRPRDSSGLAAWSKPGRGKWFTVYANSGHTYIVVGKFRFDTWGGRGPRWHKSSRSSAGFTARYAPGY